MEKKYTVKIDNIEGVDVTLQSNDFDKLVRFSNQLTREPNKEPQLDGRPKIVYTKSSKPTTKD